MPRKKRNEGIPDINNITYTNKERKQIIKGRSKATTAIIDNIRCPKKDVSIQMHEQVKNKTNE